jgi:uncharacterized OB-fold protein
MAERMQRRPNRTLRSVDEPFWRHCADDELWLQRCHDCGRLQWPPVDDCQPCGTSDLDWERVSGAGVIRSSGRYGRQYLSECPVPWDVVLVELNDGPLFIANPVGFDSETVTDGLPVAVTFIDAVDDHGAFRLPVFEHVEPVEPSGRAR